jgi:hypothetical protein
LFGINPTDDPYGIEVTTNNEFIVKAQNIIEMFDVVFSTLGPDLELLTEILQDVANKHREFGVTKVMFQ